MQTYGIKSLPQYFEKEIYQYVNISLQSSTPFLKTPPSGCYLQENVRVESLFNSEYCKIFKSTCFKNVFVKLRKTKIYP